MSEQRTEQTDDNRLTVKGVTDNTLSAPRVVHLKREPYDVRIDRQTIWGNPFVVGKDGTREQVIVKYREWINSPENAHMVEYARKTLRGKTLGCWCAPKACHGDVLLEIANAGSFASGL